MNSLIIASDDFFALRGLDCELLQRELDRATILPDREVPGDVVTMHSHVLYLDESTGERRLVTIVYPHEADAPSGRISVLAPVGAALLGLAAGQAIEWDFPHGRRHRLRVLDVVQRRRRQRDAECDAAAGER